MSKWRCLALLCVVAWLVLPTASAPSLTTEIKRIATSGPGGTMLALTGTDGQRSAKNQKILKDWARSSYRSFLDTGGGNRLDLLQCKGTLFNLGHDVRFNWVLTGTPTHSDDHRVFLADRGFRYQRILPNGDYEANIHTVNTALTIPRKGPIIFLADDIPDPATLWHEFQHTLLFEEFSGEGIYARDLGPRFVQSLWRPGVRDDDDGHHLFIEGYAERGVAAYAKLTNFEKTLLTLAEQEYQADQRGQPLTDREREQLYQPAGADYEAFLTAWGKVAPFESDPKATPLLYRYQKATGIWFSLPPDVEDFYRKGKLKLSKPTGPYPVFVPESVFKPDTLLRELRIDSRPGTAEVRENRFSQTCRLELVTKTKVATGIWGKLDIQLENPEEGYTFLKLEQEGKTLPGVAAPGRPEGSPHLIRPDVVGKAVYTLTFSHAAVDRSQRKEPFKVTVKYRDPRRPAIFDPAETLVLFHLPEAPQLNLTIVGDAEVAPGKETELRAEVQVKTSPAPALSLRWKDLTEGTDLGVGQECSFKSTQVGTHEIQVEALDSAGKRLGRAVHNIEVQAPAEVTIQGPSSVLATEVFSLEARVPASLTAKAQKFFWYRVDPRNGKREILYRMRGLVGVPELADPFQLDLGAVPTEDKKVKLQYYGAFKSHAYVVEARDRANNLLGVSKPFVVTEKPAFFDTDLPSRWSKQDSSSGSTLELSTPAPTLPTDPGSVQGTGAEGLPGGDFACTVSLRWGSGQRPDLDKGGSGPGLAGFRSVSGNRYVKGRASFSVAVDFSLRPDRPELQSAYDRWRKTAQSEVDEMLVHLRIVDKPSGSTAASVPVQVSLRAEPDTLTVKPGQVIQVTAVVQGAQAEDQPLSYEWQGDHEGKGASIRFVASKPGDYPVSVRVSGRRGTLGQAQLTFKVMASTVTLSRTDQGPLTVGGEAGLKAVVKPALGKVIYRWQPHPEVGFVSGGDVLDVPETGVPEVRAHFNKPGKVSLWVSVHDPKSGETLATSEPLEVQVGLPQLSIEISEPAPLVGQQLSARVVTPPGVKEADFRWQLPGHCILLKESQDSRQVTFFVKTTQPAELRVEVLSDGEDLGSATAALTARPYQVTALQKQPPGTVEVGTPVQLVATISPELKEKVSYRWRVNKDSVITSADFGSEVTVSRSQAGTLEATVVATDSREVELGQGRVSVSFSAPPPLTKDIQQAQQLAQAGDLKGAAAKAEEISRKDPTRGEQVKKEIAAVALEQGRASTRAESFEQAAQQLETALKLDPSNSAVGQELKTVKDYMARDAEIQKLAAEANSLLAAGRLPEAYQKLLEIDEIGNRAPTFPKGERPARRQVNEQYHQRNKEYNEYLTGFRAQREALVRAEDWAGLATLCEEATVRWGQHSQATRKEFAEGKQLALQRQSQAKQDLVRARELVDKADRLVAGSHEALNLYSQAIRLDPSQASYFCKRADTYLLSQAPQKALWDFNQAIKLDPGLAAAYAGRGLVQVRELDFEQALADLQKALQLDPSNARAHYAMGVYWQRKKMIEKAVEAFTKAAQLEPANSEYQHALQEAQAALNPLRVSIDASTSRLMAGQQVDAMAVVEGGTEPLSYTWILDVAPEGVAVGPRPYHSKVTSWHFDKPGRYRIRLVVSDAAGKSSEAQHPLTVDEKPLTATINTSASTLAPAQRLDAKAMVEGGTEPYHYQWKLVAAPEGVREGTTASGRATSWVWSVPGTYRLHLLVTDGAQRQAKAAVDVTISGPNREQQLKEIGRRAVELMEQERYDEAIVELDRMLALDPELGEGELWFTRASLKAQLGRYKEALADLEEFLQRHPEQARALGLKGHCLQALGRFDEAIPALRSAAAAETDREKKSRYLSSLGLCYQAVGEKGMAQQHFRAALEYNADNQTARTELEAMASKSPPPPPPTPARGLSVKIAPPSHRMQTGGQMRTSATATGGRAPYRYEWYVGNERTGVVNQAKMWTFNTPGVMQVRVVATDASGQTAEAFCPVTVGGQAIMADQPLSLSLSQTRISAQPGQSVSVFARPQGGTPPYSYTWYVDRQRSKVTGDGIKITPTANRTLVAEVTDSKGNSVQAQCQVTLVGGSTASTPPPSPTPPAKGGDHSGKAFHVDGVWEEKGHRNEGSKWTIRESEGRIQSITTDIRTPEGYRTNWAARNIRWDARTGRLSFDYYYTSQPPAGWLPGSVSLQFQSDNLAQVRWNDGRSSGSFTLERIGGQSYSGRMTSQQGRFSGNLSITVNGRELRAQAKGSYGDHGHPVTLNYRGQIRSNGSFSIQGSGTFTRSGRTEQLRTELSGFLQNGNYIGTYYFNCPSVADDGKWSAGRR